ncbi:hypothetical protein A8C32_17780 [Flavivirga aquatica]|uniref:Uncharacterized protein n=1 Tax=Flavivirga aquatica TaxID=1849968 RepID=A0A1E5T7D4_9FLAO|nr:hypothetical protein [Flavivirga aquatica]OEK07289.1 hypothetical protein A8C32_17780 [Flavivirga aquatica]
MGAVELRNTILSKLNTIEDSSILQGVLRYIEEYNSKDEIVAYTVQGEPLTKKEYIKKVKDADASIDAGRYTTLEDLEKEMRNW